MVNELELTVEPPVIKFLLIESVDDLKWVLDSYKTGSPFSVIYTNRDFKGKFSEMFPPPANVELSIEQDKAVWTSWHSGYGNTSYSETHTGLKIGDTLVWNQAGDAYALDETLTKISIPKPLLENIISLPSVYLKALASKREQ